MSSAREKQMANNAFDDLFSRHYPRLIAWCRRHVGRHLGEPEDFVHQAYLRCRRHWSAELRSPRHELAYLYRALRWTVSDAHRRALHQRNLTRVRDKTMSHPSTAIGELIAREAVQALPSRQRDVCLGLLAGKTLALVRAELGLSAGALAVHLSRARAKLLVAL